MNTTMTLHVTLPDTSRRAGEPQPRQMQTAANTGGKLPLDGNTALPHARPTPAADELNNAVNDLNDYVRGMQRELNFSVDEDSGRTVIKVLDPQTHEVIRQIPAEEVLALARHLAAMRDGSGHLLNTVA